MPDRVPVNPVESEPGAQSDKPGWPGVGHVLDSIPMCVPQLLAQQAAAAPHALALQSGSEVLTYDELNRRANQLAHRLRSVGIGRDKLVGLHLERSPSMVIATLAALKAGAAYLPMDPTLPARRLELMLGDAGVSAVVTRSGQPRTFGTGVPIVVDLDLERDQLAGQSSENPAVEISGRDLAYVIFTSGSTGRPKGVEITHAGLSNLIGWHCSAFQVTAADRASHQSSLSFDAAVWEVWPYLCVGASVHIPSEGLRNAPEALRDWLVEQEITITFLPTTLAESMLLLDWPSRTRLRILLTGADRLHRRPSASLPFQLVNNYGPTECTVVATSGTVAPNESASGVPSIGRAIDNTKLYLLDDQMKHVEPGIAGELYVGGPSVARGYRNHPELTAQKFIANPFTAQNGDCLYRTGDLVRQLPTGEIDFLGRVDEQIKIRGYRIEPGEIEAALNSHSDIETSVVIARDDDTSEKRLVAYLVPRGNSQPTAASLRAYLQQQLPEYMIPAAFVRLKSVPLNLSGKIDRGRLPEPDRGNSLPDSEFVAPRSVVEQRLAGVIGSLLNVERVGANDNFFYLGGHSLLGTQLLTRISRTFGVDLSLLSLFDHPTVSEISAEIEKLILEKIAAVSAETERPSLSEVRTQGKA
jgi:amino acid adenylation domain-containing protein